MGRRTEATLNVLSFMHGAVGIRTLCCVLLAVFVKLLNVLIIAIDYYPVFACVTHRQRIVANIVGILYSAQLYAILCSLYVYIMHASIERKPI